jgi:hypothetical protein
MSRSRLLPLTFAVVLAIVGWRTAGDAAAVPVQIEMRNVRLHAGAGVVLEVHELRGTMVSRVPEKPPVFDDPKSYVLSLSAARIAIDTNSLTNLMNHRVLAYDGAPLKDVVVRTAGNRLELKGKLHKGLDFNFSSKAVVSATGDGRMRLHVESMRAIGIPAKGLMDLFGLELDNLVRLRSDRGVVVEDNDIYIDPGDALPPPEIRGHLGQVAIAGSSVVQTFTPATGPRAAILRKPDSRAPNYIYFGGGSIVFGKLTMTGADLQLIDQDPRDAFDFSPADYKAQLVAGYSKNTPEGGLKTYMPDLSDLRQPTNQTARRRE